MRIIEIKSKTYWVDDIDFEILKAIFRKYQIDAVFKDGCGKELKEADHSKGGKVKKEVQRDKPSDG